MMKQAEQTTIRPGRHHVSKSYIPLTVLRGFWTMILIAVLIVFNMLQDLNTMLGIFSFGTWIMAFAAIFGVLVLIFTFFAFLSYRFLTWEITEDEIHIYRGLMVKKKSHIPFRRIHSIDINAKILDRLCGVVTFKIDTAGGSATAEDAKIPALSLSVAESLRTEIFRRKHDILGQQTAPAPGTQSNIMSAVSDANERLRGVFAGVPGVEAALDAESRLTNKELILLCLTNGKALLVIFAGLLLVQQFLDLAEVLDPALVDSAGAFSRMLLSGGPVIIGVLLALTFAVSIVISFFTRLLTYGNFVTRRYGARIEISRGLLERKITGVAVERIQTLKIRQRFLQRSLGYAEISLEMASGFGKSRNENNAATGVVIHPFIKKNKIDDYMRQMLKEFADCPREFTALTARARRRSIFRYGIYTVFFILLPLHICRAVFSANAERAMPEVVYNGMLPASAVFLILMMVAGWGAWKGRAHAGNDRYLGIRKGILGRTTAFIPRTRVQYVTVARNPFQKLAGMATLKVNTAASGSSTESLKDVTEAVGQDYLTWIEGGL